MAIGETTRLRIAELRTQGWSYDRVARAVGTTPRTVRNVCRAMGVVLATSDRQMTRSPQGTLDGIVDGRHVRGLTPDDLRRLREIDAENERAEDEGRKPDYSGVR